MDAVAADHGRRDSEPGRRPVGDSHLSAVRDGRTSADVTDVHVDAADHILEFSFGCPAADSNGDGNCDSRLYSDANTRPRPIARCDGDSAVAYTDANGKTGANPAFRGRGDRDAFAHRHSDSDAIADTLTDCFPGRAAVPCSADRSLNLNTVPGRHCSRDTIADCNSASSYADSDAPTDVDRYSDSGTDSYPCAIADLDGYAATYSASDRHIAAFANADSDAAADTNTHADAYAIADPDTNGYARAIADPDPNASPDTFTHADAAADTVPYTDGHPDALAHRISDAAALSYPRADADTVADGHPDPDSLADGYPNGTAHANSAPDRNTRGDAIAYTDRPARGASVPDAFANAISDYETLRRDSEAKR